MDIAVFNQNSSIIDIIRNVDESEITNNYDEFEDCVEAYLEELGYNPCYIQYICGNIEIHETSYKSL